MRSSRARSKARVIVLPFAVIAALEREHRGVRPSRDEPEAFELCYLSTHRRIVPAR